MLTSFPFTPCLNHGWAPAEERVFYSHTRVEFSMVFTLFVSSPTGMWFKGNSSIKPLQAILSPLSVFCLCCSCQKSLPAGLHLVLFVGLLLTGWQLEGLHELWVSSDAVYLENAGYWLVISTAPLTCKQSAESAFWYFCMTWMPDSRQGTKSWGRRETCWLMPLRSWRSEMSLKEIRKITQEIKWTFRAKETLPPAKLQFKGNRLSETQETGQILPQSHIHKPNIISTMTTSKGKLWLQTPEQLQNNFLQLMKR